MDDLGTGPRRETVSHFQNWGTIKPSIIFGLNIAWFIINLVVNVFKRYFKKCRRTAQALHGVEILPQI
jgi:hypothetical protein